MAKTAMIRANTHDKLKKQVEDIFHRLGMTTTEAINLFYRQVMVHRGLPFLVRLPNAETRRTLEKSARGEDVKSFKNIDELFSDLESCGSASRGREPTRTCSNNNCAAHRRVRASRESRRNGR